MAVVVKLLEIPPTCCHYYYYNKIKSITGRFLVDGGNRRRSNTVVRVSIRRTTTSTTSNAADTRVIDNNKNSNSNNYNYNNAAAAGVVDIPISCFQLIGVPEKAEKDEIVKSVMHLKNSEIEEGYTMDAVVSRQNLLMDVRDKLLFEPEYAGNTREKVPPKSSLRIPWAWLPGALCLLQEVGEEKLVLDIGRSALNHADAKLYVHDLLLSMALAECAIAKISFENNKISQGFEALARAQCLLRSKVSLERMPLLSQIEESLEELAPACTLEILGIPHTPENAERRLGAIAALRELLRQGLDVETSCQVQDWPCFLYQALKKLMAIEIVELLPWDNFASTRANKKSIDSQNQRVIIDCNCFYLVLIAHIALGFSSKKIDLITKAKVICDSLTASEGIDLKFEESLCSFLLGQGDESTVSEKLRQLNSISNSTSRNLISGKELKDVPGVKQSLESWIKDTILVLFPDTMDCSSSLDNFFVGEKKGGNWQNKRAPQTQSSMRLRSISHPPSDRRAYEELDSFTSTSQNLGTAVKQLASSNLQGPAVAINANSGGNGSSPSVQLKRNLGAYHRNFWDIVFGKKDHGGNIVVITALGCIFLLTFKLMGMQLRRMKITSGWASNKPWTNLSSHIWTTDSSLDQRWGPACIKGSSIARWLKQLLSTEKMSLSEAETSQKASLDGSHLFPKTAVYRRQMHMEEAEALVKQWQTTKAEALGPNHQVQSLFEVLDGPMLIQWQALADTAQIKSCFWKFVLLQLSILRAEILSDEIGNEMAEIEAFLEEAAELVDGSQQKNPNYYSTYTIRYVLKRQEDGSWRFCEGDIQTPS